MITVELKRLAKEGVIIALILVALIIGILWTEKDVYLVPALEIFLVLYAAFTGWSLFDRERSEGAMEYILSLPVSRSRFFFIKFLPRLFSVCLVLFIYMLFHGKFAIFSLIPFLDFTVVYLAFFLVSVSFSLSIKSFIGAFFLTSLFSLGLSFIIYLLDTNRSLLSVALQANLSLLVFPVLFFTAFQRFDIKPLVSFNRRFLLYSLTGLALVAISTFFFVGPRWCCYFLTNEGQLFRTSYSTNISGLIGIDKKIDLDTSLFAERQDGPWLYCMDYSDYSKKDSEGEVNRLVRLNMDSGRQELVKEMDSHWHLPGPMGKNGIFIDNYLFFFIANPNDKAYKILEINRENKNVREIPINGKTDGCMDCASLAFISNPPLRFYIYTEQNIYRFDESGSMEMFMAADAMATWKNKVLVFNQEGFALFQVNGSVDLLYRKEGDFKMMTRKFDHFGSVDCRRVIYRDRVTGKYVLFNLQTEEQLEININSRPYDYIEHNGQFYIVWVSGDEITVGELRDNQVVTRHKWSTPVPVLDGRRIIQVYPSGIIVYNHKEYDRYLFEP